MSGPVSRRLAHLVAVLGTAAVTLGAGLEAARADEAEPAIEASGAEGPYLRLMHGKVHTRWSDNFLRMAATQLPRGHALNDPGLRVVIDVVLARTGALVDAKVVEPSGAADFDAAAVEVVRDSTPMPGAPEDSLSDDGQVHLRWALARDHRRCGEVKVVQHESPLEEALPRLLAMKREREAFRRVRGAPAGQREAAVAVLAKAWLGGALGDKKLGTAAAVSLLHAGDRAGEAIAKELARKGDASAAAALARAGVSLCELFREDLAKDGTPAQATAVRVLGLRTDPACTPGLLALAQAKKAAPALRAAAWRALGSVNDPLIRKAMTEAEKDPVPVVRAAAMAAGAQPGAGRGAVFKLTPLLKDRVIEVRLAAIEGLLRAGGDLAVPQLYLVMKETDPRPYEVAAAGLGRLSSQPSADALARMLKKTDPRVRLAASAALAQRTDPAARAVLEVVKNDPDPATRVFAAAVMTDAERGAAVEALGAGPAALATYERLIAGTARVAAAEWLLDQLDAATAPGRLGLLGAWVSGTASGDVTASR